MRPNGPVRRQPKDSFIPPPPTPTYRPRDSDASSRPSSVGIGGRPTLDLYKERSIQQTAVTTINTFLASHNFPITFKPASSPSSKDIHETLKFLLSLLLDSPFKLEDDLPFLLKRLNYPFKLNKSILKSPAAPHQWPTFLALLHWLVQITKFLLNQPYLISPSPSPLQNNLLYNYTLNSYLHFIHGDDDAVEELDQQIRQKILHEKSLAQEKLQATEDEASSLKAELERLRNAPSQRELLEKEKATLENDVPKFHKIIAEFASKIEGMEKVLAEKEKQLEAKVGENERICEENGELKRRVEMQTFNARDVERMRKELQAVERDIGEAELARNTWEEKSWELDTDLSHKVKDLEALAMDCNQALRRLKIGNGLQYQLNPKGTTPAEIMGIDYKVTLKPALKSFADDIKKSSMVKLEESISHRQKSNENAARLEGKRNQLAAMQSRIDEMEAQLNMMKKETHDYTSTCSAEAKKMLEDVQLADHDLDNMEGEVAGVLKASESNLQEAIKQSEEEIQVRARKLFNLVDSVSKYKEHVGTKVSEMKRDLSETANAVSETYRGSFSAEFGRIFNATRQLEQKN